MNNYKNLKHTSDQGFGRSDEELSLLIKEKMPAIRRIAFSAKCPGLDFEDAVQEGIIGLCSAVSTFCDDKGASFDTYANVCIQNAVFTASRSASRKKHAPLNGFVPLSDNALSPGPEDIVIQNERYAEAVEKIETRLSAFERKVLGLHLSGHSYNVIAKHLGISNKSVDNALSRIRRKLRQQK